MEKLQDETEFFEALLHAIAAQFGSHCEVVLHDLTGDYGRSIVMIENGHVTGRKVGDCGSNLGLEVLRGLDRKGDRFGYVTHTPDGKILRSSTVYLRNAKGKVIGALCVNLDISNLMMTDRMLKEFFNLDAASLPSERSGASGEVFAKDVNQLLDALIQDAVRTVGKPVSMMSREDKIAAVAYLDSRGAFLISKAGTKVCTYFNMSKYTLYSYLKTIGGEDETPDAGEDEDAIPPADPGTSGKRRNTRKRDSAR